MNRDFNFGCFALNGFANRYCNIMCLLLMMVFFTLSAEARVESYDPRSTEKEPSAMAWWVAIQFKPADTSIEGIPVTQIRPNWARASVLTKDSIPPQTVEEDEGHDTMDDAGAVFSCDGDFNADGVPDRAFVGVYEDTKGKPGKFLLILTRGSAGTWKVLFVDTIPGEPGFSALHLKGKRLEWWFCMQCDDFCEIIWDRTRGRFRLKYAGPQ
jgi:hypothetical protein